MTPTSNHPAAPNLLRESSCIFFKDLMTEGRTWAMAGTAALLSITVVTACALAGSGAPRGGLAASAVWVSLAFAGVVAASGAYEREERDGTLVALLCGPVRAMALFIGKTGCIAMFTVLSAFIALLLASLLLHSGALVQAPLRSMALVLCGAVGFSLVGGLVAPLLGQGEGREAILALVLLPLGVPIVLSGAHATQALAESGPAAGAYWNGLGIVVGLDLLYLLLAMWMFEPLVRRGRVGE
ncbi:MAG: heme exporter protein CcmB [Polyangia bacterium]|jgi:heme exporter protein B|nr:heme exporter protein CcmB [Polyangia bacterium]